jgi:hypothetical protein
MHKFPTAIIDLSLLSPGWQYAGIRSDACKGRKKIFKLDDGRCSISWHDCWMPGSYADEQAAEYAFKVDEGHLIRLQNEKNDGDGTPITLADLCRRDISSRRIR